MLLDALYNICLRSRPHRSPTLRYSLGVYVLGIRYPPVVWSRSSDF